jgi:hypothetical protein
MCLSQRERDVKEYVFRSVYILLSASAVALADTKSCDDAMLFDYFSNSRADVGLKDYVSSVKLSENHRLRLGKHYVHVRVGKELAPLNRKHVRLAQDGWLPIFLVSAVEGSVRYDVRFWATPVPDVRDWKKAFDWPTEGENFLVWITVKAVNLSDKAVAAKAQVAPVRKDSKAKSKKGSKPRTDLGTYSWSWDLEPGGSAEGVARYTFSRVDDPEKYSDQDAGQWLKRTEEYWRSLFTDAIELKVPCRKATEAYMAAHVCQLIASDHGELRCGEGFYDRFYPRDGAYIMMALQEAGLHEAVKLLFWRAC